MSKLKETALKIYGGISSVAQKKIVNREEGGSVAPEVSALLRRAAAEGAVLLKNNGVLPLKKGSVVSLFGRVQNDWFYTGYGSGGDVNRQYEVNLVQGIRECDALSLNEELAKVYSGWCAKNKIAEAGWGMWPRFYPEMPISDMEVARAENKSDCAVVVIGRSSGEDRENALEKGSYYLTDEERTLLKTVRSYFEKTVVVLNIGSVIDFSWIEELDIPAVLIAWQGGMESGNAVCDILCGKVNPCGKLTDTCAAEYSDYPSSDCFGNAEYNYYKEDIYVGYRYFETFEKEKVLFPFGFGLSYTEFEISLLESKAEENGFSFTAEVKNTGSRAGKEVAQLYLGKPCAVLGNPEKELCAFVKTKELQPNEAQKISFFVSLEQLASYDESGKAGFASSYVVEAGEYDFYIGNNVRSSEKIFSYYQEETVCISTLSQCCAPKESFGAMTALESDTRRLPILRPCRANEVNLKERILNNLPPELKKSGNEKITLANVKEGKASLDDFTAQLSAVELEAITRGDYSMNSPLGASGNAGAYAGVLPSLREKGIPAVTTTDGPSGIRLSACCMLIPIGTLLASSFDEELVYEVYCAVAQEMKIRGSDVLLGPGMNIHRNVLCGRNFEYYSEDPYLTGKIGAAAVRGIQSQGGAACPKHFACNNQEFRRTINDARVSERALRQIYLKGFEICIKEAEPKNIMTSYNKINGVWSYYNYDLCTSILRGEWGYNGCVITDWWIKNGKSPDFPNVKTQAYRVRAQVDVLMPGGKRTGFRRPDGTLLSSLGKEGGITLGEIQRSAKNVIRFAMNSSAFKE